MTNLGERLRKLPNAIGVLRLCGAEVSELSSDYELFRAFCEASGLLTGNRLLSVAKADLLALNIPLAPDAETCDDIWRASVDAEFSPSVPASLPTAFEGCPEPDFSDAAFLPIPELLRLAYSGSGWKEAQEKILAGLSDRKDGVSVFLPSDFSCEQPNLYAVERALAEKNNYGLLLRQILRLLAKEEIPIFLKIAGDGVSARLFFERIESMVGLPPLFWYAPDGFDEWFPYACKPHRHRVEAVLSPDDPELARKCLEYPFGKLHFCRISCKSD